MKELLLLAEGNPGAMNCLMGMLKGDMQNSIYGLTIIPKIKELAIFGTDLYVFWSDLCNKDYGVMASMCEICPDDILKEACSRQDYSGRKLIQPYL